MNPMLLALLTLAVLGLLAGYALHRAATADVPAVLTTAARTLPALALGRGDPCGLQQQGSVFDLRIGHRLGGVLHRGGRDRCAGGAVGGLDRFLEYTVSAVSGFPLRLLDVLHGFPLVSSRCAVRRCCLGRVRGSACRSPPAARSGGGSSPCASRAAPYHLARLFGLALTPWGPAASIGEISLLTGPNGPYTPDSPADFQHAIDGGDL